MEKEEIRKCAVVIGLKGGEKMKKVVVRIHGKYFLADEKEDFNSNFPSVEDEVDLVDFFSTDSANKLAIGMAICHQEGQDY